MRAQPRLDRLEREGILAERAAGAVDERPGSADGLAVAVVRGALAATNVAVMRDLGPHDLFRVGRPARDRECLSERERSHAAGDLHGA